MCFVALKRKIHHFIHISFYFEVKKKKYMSVTTPSPSQLKLGLAHRGNAGPGTSQGFCAAHGWWELVRLGFLEGRWPL